MLETNNYKNKIHCGTFIIPTVNPPIISFNKSFCILYFGNHCIIGNNPVITFDVFREH